MAFNLMPKSSRLHIGFFGKRNSGKSALINAFCGQEVSIVSDIPGTTTDPVFHSIELPGLGGCVLIDTAGFDDSGMLGQLRIEKTKAAALKSDIAVLLFYGKLDTEFLWLDFFRQNKTAVLAVISKANTLSAGEKSALRARLQEHEIEHILEADISMPLLQSKLIDMLGLLLPEQYGLMSLTGNLCKSGDTVLLIMPQDKAAPKGRLILAQSQTISELLRKHCISLCLSPEELPAALSALNSKPQLIITDSQVFPAVYKLKPKNTKLVSFSVLFAALKGDLPYFIEGAKRIPKLSGADKVLIAESCSHAPLSEDIGRVKLPKLLRKQAGEALSIDFCSGSGFPQDLKGYSLIIHCGGCMFSRRHILARVELARKQGIAMTNYGIAIAQLSGILDKISMP